MIYKKSWKYILCKDKSSYCTDFSYYKLKVLKDFSDVKKGEFGGYVHRYHNLSQKGNCWVYENAKVKENAIVSENAQIYENAVVKDNARVYGKAKVYGNAVVRCKARVCGDTIVSKFEIISE